MKEGPFLIVKPEGLVCCPKTIERYLNESEFVITERIGIERWPELARELYTTSDTFKNMQLEAWLKTVALLFPENHQNALYLGVENGEGNILDQQKMLNVWKGKFRKAVEPSHSISIQWRKSGDSIPVYFTYVHVPDSSIEVLTTERRMLKNYLKND